KVKKLIALYFEMFFYLSIWYLIMLFGGEFKLLSAASAKYIVNIIFPFETLWFMGVYFLLCVLSPFINDYVDSLDKASQKKLLVIFGVIAVLYGFIFDWDGVGRGYTFLHGLFMYYIGMLCKKNKDSLPQKRSLYIGVYAVSALAVAGASYLAYRFSFRGIAWTIYSYNDPLIIIGAVALCLLFTLWDSENAIAKFSSRISKYVLAAYFITVRTSVVFLPIKKFIEAGRDRAVVVSSIILYAAVVFLICIPIDMGRAALFSFLNKVFHLEELYESICNRRGRSARS
nr:acyltransferase family protein [Ruminococcus sp.]